MFWDTLREIEQESFIFLVGLRIFSKDSEEAQ